MSQAPLTEDDRLTANAKALGDVCVYPWNEQGMPGITLRQWYAGLAMQGAMRELAIMAEDFEDGEVVDPKPIARDAVRMADALLKELAK